MAATTDPRIAAALAELDSLESFVHAWHRSSKASLTEQYLTFAAALATMRSPASATAGLPLSTGAGASEAATNSLPSGATTGTSTPASGGLAAVAAAPTAATIAAKALNKDAPVFRPLFGANAAATAAAPTGAQQATAPPPHAAAQRQNSSSSVNSATNGGFDWESLMGGGGGPSSTGAAAGGGGLSRQHGGHSDPLSLHTTAPNSPSAHAGGQKVSHHSAAAAAAEGSADATAATSSHATPGSFTVAAPSNQQQQQQQPLSRQPSNRIMRSASNVGSLVASAAGRGGPTPITGPTSVVVGNGGGVARPSSASAAAADPSAYGNDYDSFLDEYMGSANTAGSPASAAIVVGTGGGRRAPSSGTVITTTTASAGGPNASSSHLGNAPAPSARPMSGLIHSHNHQGNNANNSNGLQSPSALETSLLNMSGASSSSMHLASPPAGSASALQQQQQHHIVGLPVGNGNNSNSVTVGGTRSTVLAPPVGGHGHGHHHLHHLGGSSSNNNLLHAAGRGERNGGDSGALGTGFTNATSAAQVHAAGAASCQALVEFKRKRVLQFESKEFVTAGEFVVVGGDRGEDIGVVTHVWPTGAAEPTGAWNGSIGVGKVLRPATLLEISQLQGVQFELESRAVEVAQEKVAEHQLPMRIVDAEYQFDRKKLTFYYQSNHRLDFRNLVRDLYKTFRARIWMEQD